MTHLARERYETGHGEPIQALRLGAKTRRMNMEPQGVLSRAVSPGVSVVRIAVTGRALLDFGEDNTVGDEHLLLAGVEYFRVEPGETVTITAIDTIDASISEC